MQMDISKGLIIAIKVVAIITTLFFFILSMNNPAVIYFLLFVLLAMMLFLGFGRLEEWNKRTAMDKMLAQATTPAPSEEEEEQAEPALPSQVVMEQPEQKEVEPKQDDKPARRFIKRRIRK